MNNKMTILAMLLALLSLQGFAQKDPVERIFERFSGREGYTTVYISSKMFSMFSEAGIDDPEFNALMHDLRSIRILAADKGGTQGPDFLDMVGRELPANVYEELMTVTEPGQKVKFLVREEKGKIVELLMVVGGSDNVLIDIRGNIDLKKISQLSKAIRIEGLDELEKLDNGKK